MTLIIKEEVVVVVVVVCLLSYDADCICLGIVCSDEPISQVGVLVVGMSVSCDS